MRAVCCMLLTAALAGCAGVAPAPGVPARVTVRAVQPPQAFLDFVTADVAAMLTERYPPARQPVILARAFETPLDRSVVVALRKLGYAIQESSSVLDARARFAAGQAPGEHSAGLFAVDPILLDVRYNAADTDLHYIRIDAGTLVLSRAYVVTVDGATPAGAWAHLERAR